MISGGVKFDDQPALKRLAELGAGLQPTAVAATWAFVGYVTADVIKNKLSGQVLNRITGNLQRHVSAAQYVLARGGRVLGVVGVSNLNYGVWHEEGFSGKVVVQAHERREHFVADYVRRVKGGGQVGVTGHQVRAHTVKEHMARRVVPAKWFIRNTLTADQPVGVRILNKAVDVLATTGKVPTRAQLRVT